jgi:hypothetical protein
MSLTAQKKNFHRCGRIRFFGMVLLIQVKAGKCNAPIMTLATPLLPAKIKKYILPEKSLRAKIFFAWVRPPPYLSGSTTILITPWCGFG